MDGSLRQRSSREIGEWFSEWCPISLLLLPECDESEKLLLLLLPERTEPDPSDRALRFVG